MSGIIDSMKETQARDQTVSYVYAAPILLLNGSL